MEKLYTANRYNELLNLKKKNKILGLSFLGAFVITLLIFILVATYQTRVIMDIIGAILCTIETLLSIFFFIKMNIYKRMCFEFNTLLTAKVETKRAVFLDISLNPYTLSDKSKSYVVKVQGKKGNETLYLSSLFEGNLFEPNKTYKFLTAYEYIVGYENEN